MSSTDAAADGEVARLTAVRVLLMQQTTVGTKIRLGVVKTAQEAALRDAVDAGDSGARRSAPVGGVAAPQGPGARVRVSARASGRTCAAL